MVSPGGILTIGTLNRTPRSYVTAIIAAEYVLGWLPRGTHEWRKFVTPEELNFSLKRQGFELAESCGVVVNPLTMSWAISSDLSTNYLQFHRRTGLEARPHEDRIASSARP